MPFNEDWGAPERAPQYPPTSFFGLAWLLGFGGPVGLVLDADLLHLAELLAPVRLLLVTPAAVGDLLPLGRRVVERRLRRLAAGERLGDLERQLALVLVRAGDDRVRHDERERLEDGVEILVGAGERFPEGRRLEVRVAPRIHDRL